VVGVGLFCTEFLHLFFLFGKIDSYKKREGVMVVRIKNFLEKKIVVTISTTQFHIHPPSFFYFFKKSKKKVSVCDLACGLLPG